jgi:FkbM family methyltransferase
VFVSYAQNFEDIMLWRALKDIKGGFYIDIGSENPFVDSISYGFSLNGWSGLSVEANPSYYDLFKQKRPKDRIINAFVSNKKENIDFYIFDNTGLSTADKSFAEMHIQKGLAYHIVKTKSITFDDLVEKESINSDIHWMKIDVEGFEKNVLLGWTSGIRPWVLVIEAMVPNNQIPTHEEWQYILFEKGYHFVYADGLNRFYIHEDHLDLKNHFIYPPNPLQDYYILSSNHEIQLKYLDLEKEKNQLEDIVKKTEYWGKDLEKQIFEQQKHIENKDRLIDELSHKVLRIDIALKEQELKTQDALGLLDEKSQEVDNLQKRLSDEEEKSFLLDTLLKEQEVKTQDVLVLLDEKSQEVDNLQKRLSDEEEKSFLLDTLLKEQEIKTQDALALFNEKSQEVNTLQKRLSDEEEKSLHLDVLLKEQEVKTQDVLVLLDEKSQEVDNLQKRLSDEEEKALHLDALLKEQEIKTQDALGLLDEKSQEAEMLQNSLDNVYNSKSWKITRPLRELNMFKNKLIKKMFYILIKKPQLKKYALQLEKALPHLLRIKIRHFYGHNVKRNNNFFINDLPKTPDALTPNEKEIYQKLLHHINAQKGN